MASAYQREETFCEVTTPKIQQVSMQRCGFINTLTLITLLVVTVAADDVLVSLVATYVSEYKRVTRFDVLKERLHICMPLQRLSRPLGCSTTMGLSTKKLHEARTIFLYFVFVLNPYGSMIIHELYLDSRAIRVSFTQRAAQAVLPSLTYQAKLLTLNPCSLDRDQRFHTAVY